MALSLERITTVLGDKNSNPLCGPIGGANCRWKTLDVRCFHNTTESGHSEVFSLGSCATSFKNLNVLLRNQLLRNSKLAYRNHFYKFSSVIGQISYVSSSHWLPKDAGTNAP